MHSSTPTLQRDTRAWQFQVWASFGIAVFLCATGLAWLLWLFVLQRLSAGVAGLSALGIPMVGALAGWIELGERPTPVEFAGMALIVGALALVSLWSLRQARSAPPR